MQRLNLAALLVTATVLIGVVGCSGGDDDDVTAEPTTTAAAGSETSPDPASAATTTTVDIEALEDRFCELVKETSLATPPSSAEVSSESELEDFKEEVSAYLDGVRELVAAAPPRIRLNFDTIQDAAETFNTTVQAVPDVETLTATLPKAQAALATPDVITAGDNISLFIAGTCLVEGG